MAFEEGECWLAEDPLFCFVNWSGSQGNNLPKGARRRPYVVNGRLPQENIKCSPKLRDRNIVHRERDL